MKNLTEEQLIELCRVSKADITPEQYIELNSRNGLVDVNHALTAIKYARNEGSPRQIRHFERTYNLTKGQY